MLDVAHRPPSGKAPVLRFEAGQQGVERLVQQRPLAWVGVGELVPVRRQVVGNRLPVVKQAFNGNAQRRLTPDHVRSLGSV